MRAKVSSMSTKARHVSGSRRGDILFRLGRERRLQFDQDGVFRNGAQAESFRRILEFAAADDLADMAIWLRMIDGSSSSQIQGLADCSLAVAIAEGIS